MSLLLAWVFDENPESPRGPELNNAIWPDLVNAEAIHLRASQLWGDDVCIWRGVAERCLRGAVDPPICLAQCRDCYCSGPDADRTVRFRALDSPRRGVVLSASTGTASAGVSLSAQRKVNGRQDTLPGTADRPPEAPGLQLFPSAAGRNSVWVRDDQGHTCHPLVKEAQALRDRASQVVEQAEISAEQDGMPKSNSSIAETLAATVDDTVATLTTALRGWPYGLGPLEKDFAALRLADAHLSLCRCLRLLKQWQARDNHCDAVAVCRRHALSLADAVESLRSELTS